MITKFEQVHHYNVTTNYNGTREYIYETVGGYKGDIIADVTDVVRSEFCGNYLGCIAALNGHAYKVYALYTNGNYTVAVEQ